MSKRPTQQGIVLTFRSGGEILILQPPTALQSMNVQYAAAASVYSEGDELMFRRMRETKPVQIKKTNQRQLSLGPLQCLRRAFFPTKKSPIETSLSTTDPAEGVQDDDVEQVFGSDDDTDISACVSSDEPSKLEQVAWNSDMALAGDEPLENEDISPEEGGNESFGNLFTAAMPRDLTRALKHIDSSSSSTGSTKLQKIQRRRSLGKSSTELSLDGSSLLTQKRSHTEKTTSYLQLSILDDLLHDLDEDVDERSTTSDPRPQLKSCDKTTTVIEKLEQVDTQDNLSAGGDSVSLVDLTNGLKAEHMESVRLEIDEVKPIRRTANTKRSRSFLQLNLTKRKF